MLVGAGELRFVDAEVSFPDSLDIYSKLGDVDTWIDLPDGLWPERADELDPQLIAGYEKGDWLDRPQVRDDVHTAQRSRAQARRALRRDRRAGHADRGDPGVPCGRTHAA